MKKFFLTFHFLSLFLYAITFPELTGRVVDNANILSSEVASTLSAKLENLEHNTSDQLVVVTLKSLQGLDIADYGLQLGRHWGIGQKDKDNGVLLILAPNERKIRIEVGYGLEGLLTDMQASYIIENIIIPLMKKSDFDAAATDGTNNIIARLKGEAMESLASTSKGFNYKLLYIIVPFMLIVITMLYFSTGRNLLVTSFIVTVVVLLMGTILFSEELDFNPFYLIFGFFGLVILGMFLYPILHSILNDRKNIIPSLLFPVMILLFFLHVKFGYLPETLSFFLTIIVLVIIALAREKAKPYKVIDKSMAIAFGVFVLDLAITGHYLPPLVYAGFAFTLCYGTDPKVLSSFSGGSSRRGGSGGSSGGGFSGGGGSFGGGGSSGSY